MSELQKTVDTHLYEAAKIGNITLMQDALNNGADIHYKDDCALQWSCHEGQYDATQYLLEQGGDPNADNGKPLKWAAEEGHQRIVHLLLIHGANFHTLSTEMKAEYASTYERSIMERVDQRLEQPYQLFNDHTVLKFEGRIREVGDLHKIFDFSARTLTQMVGKAPATPLLFSQFRDNRDEIIEVYDWLKKQGKDAPHPFVTGNTRNIRSR